MRTAYFPDRLTDYYVSDNGDGSYDVIRLNDAQGYRVYDVIGLQFDNGFYPIEIFTMFYHFQGGVLEYEFIDKKDGTYLIESLYESKIVNNYGTLYFADCTYEINIDESPYRKVIMRAPYQGDIENMDNYERGNARSELIDNLDIELELAGDGRYDRGRNDLGYENEDFM